MVHQIQNKLITTWNAEIKAIVDTWENYFVTLDQFKEAVMVKGINHAKANAGVAWIVDSSNAKGVFSSEIQKFIETDAFPAFSKIGIKYFITITSKASAITNMTVATYSSKTGPAGLELLEVNSLNDAIAWLKTK